ncbi:hypothetical protein QFC22_006607 [Naganishia vaughanmartiniae]|uniref:Uncharacterized protein n=1 Tax=Naganishia vaughanmartiniae TaxID=1424756 RepID=A0ACC2WHZ5_9TREE|nr:hypothetical protein QFC22_006607 [Naganishia vaughanmartiniae]
MHPDACREIKNMCDVNSPKKPICSVFRLGGILGVRAALRITFADRYRLAAAYACLLEEGAISINVVCKSTLHLGRVLRQYRQAFCLDPAACVPLNIQLQGIERSGTISSQTVSQMINFFQCFPLAEYRFAARCSRDYPTLAIFTIEEAGIRYDSTKDNLVIWDHTDDHRLETGMPLLEFRKRAQWVEPVYEDSGDLDEVGDVDAEWEQRGPQRLGDYDSDELRPDGPDARFVNPDIYFEDDEMT